MPPPEGSLSGATDSELHHLPMPCCHCTTTAHACCSTLLVIGACFLFLIGSGPLGTVGNGTCVFRTANPLIPDSYRGWNGTHWSTTWINPYTVRRYAACLCVVRGACACVWACGCASDSDCTFASAPMHERTATFITSFNSSSLSNRNHPSLPSFGATRARLLSRTEQQVTCAQTISILKSLPML